MAMYIYMYTFWLFCCCGQLSASSSGLRSIQVALMAGLGSLYQFGLANLCDTPVVPFFPFLGEGSPTKIGYRKKGTLEDLAEATKRLASGDRCPNGVINGMPPHNLLMREETRYHHFVSSCIEQLVSTLFT